MDICPPEAVLWVCKCDTARTTQSSGGLEHLEAHQPSKSLLCEASLQYALIKPSVYSWGPFVGGGEANKVRNVGVFYFFLSRVPQLSVMNQRKTKMFS